MLNNIYIGGKLVTDRIISGRLGYFLLEDQSRIYGVSQNYKRDDIKIECSICKNKFKIKTVTTTPAGHTKKRYECFSCVKMGEKNNFYGKKHTEEFKNRLSKKRMGKATRTDGRSIHQCWIDKYGQEEADKKMIIYLQKQSLSHSGKNNHFFGKTHSPEIQQQIVVSIKKWREGLTELDKEILHKNAVLGAQKAKTKKGYKESKIQAGRASHISQFKNAKKNRIETIVQQKLIELGLDFEYSVILGHRQYDFGSKQYRILLEVQGDYWHCNPEIYATPKNQIQEEQIKKDILKKEFALKHNFMLFCIWEKDIKNNNFKVIDDIKSYINNLIEK